MELLLANKQEETSAYRQKGELLGTELAKDDKPLSTRPADSLPNVNTNSGMNPESSTLEKTAMISDTFNHDDNDNINKVPDEAFMDTPCSPILRLTRLSRIHKGARDLPDD